MKTYKFQIRKELSNGSFKTESIQLDLSDDQYNSIKSDNETYDKGSALVSSLLGEKVHTLGFPTQVNITSKSNVKENIDNQKAPKSSLWKPLWALPFKLIWRILKFIWRLIFGKKK